MLREQIGPHYQIKHYDDTELQGMPVLPGGISHG